jgi:hypothetical protein
MTPRRSFAIALLTTLLLMSCRAIMPGPAPAATEATLPRVDWPAYHDDLAGFTIQRPPTWQQVENGGYPIVYALEMGPGTNLIEKRMEINVRPEAAGCRQATYGAGASIGTRLHVSLNGIDWLQETGGGVALGNFHDWTSYSTVKGPECITLTFVLHSSSSGVYSTEPAQFDKTAESAIFGELLDTFRFDR